MVHILSPWIGYVKESFGMKRQVRRKAHQVARAEAVPPALARTPRVASVLLKDVVDIRGRHRSRTVALRKRLREELAQMLVAVQVPTVLVTHDPEDVKTLA